MRQNKNMSAAEPGAGCEAVHIRCQADEARQGSRAAHRLVAAGDNRVPQRTHVLALEWHPEHMNARCIMLIQQATLTAPFDRLQPTCGSFHGQRGSKVDPAPVGHELVQQTADRPHVGGGTVWPVVPDLRRHVVRRTWQHHMRLGSVGALDQSTPWRGSRYLGMMQCDFVAGSHWPGMVHLHEPMHQPNTNNTSAQDAPTRLCLTNLRLGRHALCLCQLCDAKVAQL